MRPSVEGPLRVLLVDDALDLRGLIRVGLERDDRFEVVGEASDGREAITAAAETRPDVIVLDHMMPVMSGLEALPQLRTVAPDARIVLFSAVADRLASTGSPDDVDAFVPKGGDLDELIAAMVPD